jgi:hypothetical protein
MVVVGFDQWRFAVRVVVLVAGDQMEYFTSFLAVETWSKYNT